MKKSWQMFDQISPNYDQINRILSFGMDLSWRRFAASHLPKALDLHLLDVASGTGDQLIACMESGASIASSIGIDLSQEMLRIGEKKIAQKPYRERTELLLGDAEKLPFADGSFDAATFSFGIRNVVHPIQALQEMRRVLNPKGVGLILEFSLPPQPFKFFHLFYLRYLLPWIGGLFSKDRVAYRYLNQTIEAFPYGKAFCSLMEQAGFCQVEAFPLALGAVTLYRGVNR